MFEVVEPTATACSGFYWKKALREANILQYLPSNTMQTFANPDILEKDLPILGCLMQNGHTASITISVLLANNHWVSVDEAKLVKEVVTWFIQSNGLLRLQWPKEKEAAVAVAPSGFAIHLFQWNAEMPSPSIDEAELHKWLYELQSGVKFSKDVLRVSKKCPLMTALVSSYGMLEQNHIPFEEDFNAEDQQILYTISNPFVMRPSQQLVALWLLGGDLSAMVTCNPYGFDDAYLKASLGALSVVGKSSRPSIADTLRKLASNITRQVLMH